jgi:hypothetical protein
MLPNVAGAARRRLQCHDAESLRALAETGGESGEGAGSGGCRGWAYTVERSPSGVPKPGWIASSPGAACTFAYPLGNASTSAPVHRIGLGYLKSYEHMGTIEVTCVHQCTCAPLRIDAHSAERISPLDLVYLSATLEPSVRVVSGHASTPTTFGAAAAAATTTAATTAAAAAATAAPAAARKCGIRLTVLDATSSGEHKFKLTALFLNQHGDAAYFGRWIFSQAAEARGAVEVAEAAEQRSRQRAKLRSLLGRGRRGRGGRGGAGAGGR